MENNQPEWWGSFQAAMTSSNAEEKRRKLKELGSENLNKANTWLDQQQMGFEQSIAGKDNVAGAGDIRNKFQADREEIQSALGDITTLEREQARINALKKGSPGRSQTNPMSALASVLNSPTSGTSILGFN